MNENNANFTPAAPNFKTLVRMSFQGLTNFPYIEEDFDALTNYELLSKVVEYLNEVISNNNEQNTVITGLYNAYVSLQGYVNDYFDNLDVQDEINNKLDEMTESGALTTLIKNYVDPIYEAYEERIDNEVDTINAKVNSLSSGAPIPVSSTSEMTDTTKIYLNTTDGYWYYYNNGSWTQGGVYQASVDSDDVALLKYTDSMISEDTNNLFDMTKLLNATGWELDENGVATGTIRNLRTAYGDNTSDFIVFNGTDTKFYFKCSVRNLGETVTDSRGFTVTVEYTDGTTSGGNVKNLATTWTDLVVTSKTVDTAPIKAIYFSAGSGLDNTWEIKDAIFVTGSRDAVSYYPHKTAFDRVARNDIENIESDIDNIESDISELRGLYSLDGSYGIKINPDGTVNRFGDAIGLNNNYIIGSSMAYQRDNDFDNVYPWSDMKLCNIKESPINEMDIYYENDPLFTRDGTNGDVYVEIPKFYTKRYKDSNGADIILISGTRKGGYYLEPAFVNSKTGEEIEKIYVAAYLSSDNGTKLDSYSGSFPMANKNKNYIKTLQGDMYDFVTLQALQKLIMIEFAEINFSPILGGLSDMVWTSCKAYETKSDTNTAIFGGGAYINNLVVGSTIGIGDTFGVIQNRTITAITEVRQNVREITFDGDPVSVVLEQTYLYSTGQKSGVTDSLNYHTGRNNLVADKPMANQFKYRNIEGLWGNLGEIMDGVIVKGLRLYWDNLKDNYTDVTKMKKLNYAMPLQNTYSSSPNPLPSQIKEMGLDFRNPTILAPEVLAEWDDTYYGDAFFSIYDTNQEGRPVSIDTEYVGISSMAWDGKAQNGLFTLRFWLTANNQGILYGTRKIIRNY